MAPHLILAPAASGKTQTAISKIRGVLGDTPLVRIWVVLPDRNQASVFNRRLAEAGGALGAQVGTFQDLYLEVLALAGKSLPLAPDPLVHRLTRTAIQNLGAGLVHYRPIAGRPGFIEALGDLIAELKRALITPEQFEQAVRGEGPRLTELAAIYGAYQSALIRLNWADGEGLGWLAVAALEEDPALASDWRLVVADGFDSFNPVSLKSLALLSTRVGEMCLTLTGDREMKRTVERRFKDTFEKIKQALNPEVEVLAPYRAAVPAIAHLANCLFEHDGDKIDAPDGIQWAEAQTMRLEAREALRWLKARIVRDGAPADECAVIARDLNSYRPFLQEAAVEFGLPIRFLGGEPLEKNPAIAAIVNLLGLAPKFMRRPLVDAVRTPYLNLSPWGLSRTDAGRLDQVARKGQVIEGLEQWKQVLRDLAAQAQESTPESEDDNPLPALPKGVEAERLLDGLAAFVKNITPPEQNSLHGYLTWTQDLLFGPNGLGVLDQVQTQEGSAARDLAALTALGETLDALRLAEEVGGKREEINWEQFLAELRGAIQVVTYTPDDPRTWRQSRIYAGNTNTTRGIPYRAVALLGLSEGLFPAPVAEDPFLSDDDRTRLCALGLELEPRARSDQQTLFYEAVARAGQFLLLTRPYLADDGELWQPSPYWNATRALFNLDGLEPPKARVDDVRPLPDAASPLELLAGAMRVGTLPAAFAGLNDEWAIARAGGLVLRARLAREPSGEFEGLAQSVSARLGTEYGPGHVWSPTSLEKFGTCPYYFYLASALDLEPREAPEEGYDSAQLGSMLHRILELTYGRAPNPEDLAELLSTLEGAAKEVFDSAPDRHGFRPTPLWEMQRGELLEKLGETVTKLHAASNGYKPIRFEARYGFETPPLVVKSSAGDISLHGVIDRVDRNEEGELRIVDYKTGSSGYSPDDLVEGRRLQLPLYAAAAEQVLHLGRVVDGFYWAILKGKASALQLKRFKHETESGEHLAGAGGALEVAARHLGADVAAIREGRFVPAPPSAGCPEYCPGSLFCWRYAPRDF